MGSVMITVIHDNERENRNMVEFAGIAISQLNFVADRKIVIDITQFDSQNSINRTTVTTLGDLITLPDQFTVRVQKGLPSAVQAVTICHELIHVHQIITGKLSVSAIDGWLWNGEYYSTSSKYDERPWEILAREQERPLLHSVLKEYRS